MGTAVGMSFWAAHGVCDSSSGGKFWAVAVSGSELKTTWGKVGTPGQSKTKDFGTDDKALKEAQKLVKAKSKGGYVMAGSGPLVSAEMETKKRKAPAQTK